MGILNTLSTVFSIIMYILLVIGCWNIFEKAGVEGWKALIPFYNIFVFFKIIYGTGWLCLFLLIPIIDFFAYGFTLYKLSRRFGKDIWFTLGLIFFPEIFLIILGFDNSRYNRYL